MRKLFSLLTAILFAGSMFATEVVFTNADFAGQGTPNTGSEVSATKDGVTFTFSKGYSADESLRCYAHGAMSIKAASTIAKINFTTTGGKTGGLDAEVAVNATSYEVADLASQARLTEIKVTLGEGGEEPGDEPGDDPQPVTDPTNCAEAAAAALSVAENNALYNDGKEYTIQGFVTEIAYALKDGSMSFWMADTKDGGKVLEAYKCAVDDEANAPAVGDKVAVIGKLTKYNTTPEFAAGCTVEILEKGEVVPVDPVKEPTNCAEAAAAALSVAENNALYNDGKEYTIQGFVTEIAYALKNGSMSFWMADTKDGGKVLEAYKCAIDDEANAPAVGDKVAVTGKLTKYNTTPEFAAGCTVEILEKGEVVPVDPVKEPTNCAEAAAAALSVADNNALYNDGKEYTIQGFVTEIAYALKDGSMSFWMADTKDGGKVLEAYKCAVDDEANAPAVGDKVAVTGKLTKYNSTPEFAAGCTVEIIEKAAVEPGEDVEITLNSLTNPGSLIWTDAVEVEGWWQIMGAGKSYDFSLSNISTEQTAGVYTVKDLDEEYSYISIYGEKDTVDVAFADGSVTVAVSEEGIVTVKGTLVGADGNNYIFDLTYKDPVAENTVDVAISEWALIDDYVESYGLFVLSGNAEDETHVMLSLWMPEGATDIYGDYTEEDFDLQNFGCGIIDANGVAPSIFSADIKVESAENGDVLVTADLLCYNNTLYRVTTVNAGQGFENVDAAVKAIKSIVNGQLVIEKAGKRYNALGTVIR